MYIDRKRFHYSASDLENKRNVFERSSCVKLPNFIPTSLAEQFISQIDSAGWIDKSFSRGTQVEFARDLTMDPANSLVHGLHLLLNNPALFSVIEQLTGCPEIKGFQGRIYRQMPSSGHYLDWHDDRSDASRLVGISVNLTPALYDGGIFRIREKGSSELLAEVSHGRPGDAHLFRISARVEHCLTPLTGTSPRTAFAGWFQSSASYLRAWHDQIVKRNMVIKNT